MKRKKRMGLMRALTSTNDIRIEEDDSRPRVEIWPDAWIDWVESHRAKKLGERSVDVCGFPGLRNSPFCGLGHH